MAQHSAVTKEETKHSPALVSKHATAYDKFSRLQLATRWFRNIMVGKADGSIREIIEDALQEESDAALGAISLEEKKLLKNMIHFGEITVRDIMVPRSEIMGLSCNVSLEELKQHVIDIGHTRIPVFDETLDKIDGFIHVKDLFPYLAAGQSFDMARVIRETLFVPPSMRIVDLLLKMRVSGCHIAIVVDEFGGTSGMVTMEDLFEELVGEIQDEHDREDRDHMLRWLGDHALEADARAKIEDVETALGEKLNGEIKGDYDTLGGLIFFTLGRVPVKGEVVKLHQKFRIEILAADPRKIRHVRITRLTVPHS